MKKSVFFLLIAGLIAGFPGKLWSQETHLNFDCGFYYFSEGPLASETQIEDFLKKVSANLEEDFSRVEGDLTGSVRIIPRTRIGFFGEDQALAFSEVFPAVVMVEGAGAERVLEQFDRTKAFPRILVFLNVPNAAALDIDFPVHKVISVFGAGAPEEARIPVEDAARDFNLQIRDASHVNLWQDLKLQDFMADVLKIAIMESLFSEQGTWPQTESREAS